MGGGEGLPVVGIDNLRTRCRWSPPSCRSDASSSSARRARACPTGPAATLDLVCSITQYGSTRSINAGVASGIAMHTWTCQHADPTEDPGPV